MPRALANLALESSRVSVQPDVQPRDLRIHSCRWEWCRLTFSINAELVHHVIHDHVRQAAPVMRKDIPMLKRAEEGIGESMSGFTYQSHENQLSSSLKSTEYVPADVEPSSSLPSPPASSPQQHSPASSDSELGNFSEAHAYSPKNYDASPSPPPEMQQQPSLCRSTSPEGRHVNPTFASLLSPTGSPALPAVPGSPSFDSLVYDAIHGQRQREKQPFSFSPSLSSQWESSQETQNSFASQNSVENQLTQSMDIDNDETEYSQHNKHTTAPVNADTPAQADEISYKGELQRSFQIAQSSPRLSRTTSLAPLQTQQLTPSTVPIGALNTPTTALHTPKVPQPWYQAPRSLMNRKSRQSSSFPATDPTAVSDSSLQRIYPSQDQNHCPNPLPMTPRPSGNVFQSGTLQITPTTSESLQPEYGGSAGDVASLPSRSSMGWSQTQSQMSWLQHMSYAPLQTQAPYQSQSYQSQSTSSSQ